MHIVLQNLGEGNVNAYTCRSILGGFTAVKAVIFCKELDPNESTEVS